ncbi:autotransporter assembly complex protein TamA [Chitinibacteraceae bacterium HSL-7]
MAWRHLLASLTLGALTAPVWGEPIPYRVSITAPDAAESLLEKHLDLVRWQKRAVEDSELEALIRRTPDEAASLLATQGYFSPTINVRRESAEQIVVEVDVGPLTTVRKIDLHIEGAINDDSDMLERLNRRLAREPALEEGSAFTQSAWATFKRRPVTLLQSRKYAAARMLSSEAKVDPDAHAADLTLIYDSGPAYQFGKTTISGMERYPEKIVASQLKIEEGDEYSQSELREQQTALQDIPQLATVIVDPKLSTSEPYIADLNVIVGETKRNKLSGEIGYNSTTGARTELKYRYYNLANRGWVLDTNVRLERYEQEIGAAILFPRHRSGWDHSVYTDLESSDINGLDTRTYKVGVSRSRKDDRFDRTLFAEYTLEQREQLSGEMQHPQTLALGFNWVRRDVNSIRNPRRGSVIQVKTAAGSEALLSDANFLMVRASGIQYWPVLKKHVLMTRLELGQNFTDDPNDIPTDYLFRAGGAGSVRGYDYEALGVRQPDGTVLPGRVIGTATVEYQHTVLDGWRAALFADYGDAANSWDEYEGELGLGTGVRWISPVGVLGADAAYGVEDQKWRYYLSLGVSF